jgi:hypothetical protein
LKTALKHFCRKSMSKTKTKNSDKNFDVSFPSTFFVLSRFRVFFSDGSSKALVTTKKRVFFNKKIVSKSFYKKFDQKSKTKTDCFSVVFYRVFGRFSARGVQKHDKKYREKKSDPGPFSASDPPTHHGGPRFFFLAAPCIGPWAVPGCLPPSALQGGSMWQARACQPRTHQMHRPYAIAGAGGPVPVSPRTNLSPGPAVVTCFFPSLRSPATSTRY